MQVQATAVMADVVSGPAVGDLTGWRGNPLDAEEDFELGGAPPVTVISAAVLRVARVGYRESREDFAARARVPVDVVAGVEDGRYPAWALAYPLYAAVEAAVGVLNPGLRVAFDAGSSADLLLSFVLAGVGLAGGEPLCGGDRERQVMGRALLRHGRASGDRVRQGAGHAAAAGRTTDSGAAGAGCLARRRRLLRGVLTGR